MASLRDSRPAPVALAGPSDPAEGCRSVGFVRAQAEGEISRYILEQLAEMPHRRLDPDTPLFETLLDSTSVLALAGFLEQRYGVEIGDAEIVPANFSTLNRLCDYLQRKTQTAVAPLAATG